MTTEQQDELTCGQLLRQAREIKNVSVQQVALQLNLKAELIEQIEQDKLDPAILETFVRGYLRAYARYLKLPEQDIIKAFERQTGIATVAVKPMRTFSNRTANQATENRFMWLTYAIGLFLLALLFIWWWQTSQQLPLTSTAIDVPAGEQEETTPVSVPDYLPAEQDTVASEPDPALLQNDLAETNTQENEHLTDNTIIAMATLPVVPEDIPVIAEAAPQTLLTAVDSLKMIFRENCWIDVVDADGGRIAYGTKQAGYIMEVTGKAPFVITLGNPSVVDIELNQQPFDLSAFPGGRVAKFTLPGQD